MLSAAVTRGFLLGFFVGSRHSGVVDISHLLFADSLVFVGLSLTTLAFCVLYLYFSNMSLI
jgi:hypothetical protein